MTAEDPNPEIRILPAETHHAAEILGIQRKAFYSEAVLHNNFHIPPLTQTLESLLKDFSEFKFYIAEEESHIVGSLKVKSLDEDTLWIGRLTVDPEFQKKGIGSALMRFIEEIHPEKTCFELFTAEKSVSNIRFYTRLGYSITKRFREDAHEDITLVKMVKEKI